MPTKKEKTKSKPAAKPQAKEWNVVLADNKIAEMSGLGRRCEVSDIKLYHGDCLEVMKNLEANSVDSIVCDPPYALAFMGAEFDTFHKEGVSDNVAFHQTMTPIFAEALRIAKPGAHILAFGGTRTYHRLACAIEDAGWEVRDCIMWVYGSGFPKSMDVAKAIDKASGYEGEVIGSRVVDVGMQGGNMHAGRNQQQQQQIRALSPEAAAWNGWGTCLKPACEPIVVARKPLEGTVAANVLKYGTGAINIDGCRVPTEDNVTTHGVTNKKDGNTGWTFGNMGNVPAGQSEGQKLGRFPANLIHDGSDEVLALFPDTGKSGIAVRHNSGGCTFGGNSKKPPMNDMSYSDFGSAARFFYCAKASRSERGEGNIHPTVKPLALMRYLVRLVTRTGGVVLDPFMGSGTTGVAALDEGCRFVGIEKDQHYFDIAKKRIEKEQSTPMQGELLEPSSLH